MIYVYENDSTTDVLHVRGRAGTRAASVPLSALLAPSGTVRRIALSRVMRELRRRDGAVVPGSVLARWWS
ncbi:hypothetical protein [Miltoncostaea marina]|uniref:hypothetical protein n=1 Tax=Miltoncostaea marina TaxID=2843215 RepID=UPI001C3CFE14|nr:hypothetical protein [Miltoncostaea marina]